METIRQQIRAYLQENRDTIVDELKALVRIPSVRGEAAAGAPFGRSCADALLHTQRLYEAYGFETALDEDGGYLLSYYGTGSRSLGLFAHSDVVPAGDGWTLTEPFAPTEIDGCLIGRGVMDDKGAVIASLYAARMIRELQLPFHSRLVMFTGSAEESGMGDLKNYLAKHTPPDFSLVPDTAFPLYRGNKGRILLRAERAASLGEVLRFYGGRAGTNVGYAEAVLPFREDLLVYLQSRTTEKLTVETKENEIILKAVGLEKHTALPDGSVNAAALIADVLRTCPLLSEETQNISDFLYGVCSDYYGGYPGIRCADAEFGPLTFVNYQIDADDAAAVLYFNIRYGAAVQAEEMKQTLMQRFAAYGFQMKIIDESKPHIVPRDHPMLRCLIDTYEAYTQTPNAPMYVNAGGTYGQLLPCAAEIGVALRHTRPAGMPAGHGAVHQPDECICIQELLNGIELTTLMLLACDAAAGGEPT